MDSFSLGRVSSSSHQLDSQRDGSSQTGENGHNKLQPLHVHSHMLFLAAGLAGGFILAWKSIEFQYMGALACFTVVFTLGLV